MKDLPFWFPNKKTSVWYLLFIVLFLFSIDFWGWGNSKPLILGLPLWVYYFIFLTIFTSLCFYVFTKYQWEENK